MLNVGRPLDEADGGQAVLTGPAGRADELTGLTGLLKHTSRRQSFQLDMGALVPPRPGHLL